MNRLVHWVRWWRWFLTGPNHIKLMLWGIDNETQDIMVARWIEKEPQRKERVQ